MSNASSFARRVIQAERAAAKKHPFNKVKRRRYYEKRMGIVNEETLHEKSLEADEATKRIVRSVERTFLPEDKTTMKPSLLHKLMRLMRFVRK